MAKKNISDFPGIQAFITEYYDTLFIDSKLSDSKVIALIIYNNDFVNKKIGAPIRYVVKQFTRLNRKEKYFAKAKSLSKKSGIIEEKYIASQKSDCLLLTKKGIDQVNTLIGASIKSPVYVIKSGEKFSSLKLIEEFLSKEMKTNEILLCDSYISEKTLYPFSILKGHLQTLKILTSNIQDVPKFEHSKNNLLTECKISVDIKINKKLHDRYILGKDKCWTLGTSIKDIGNKDTIIRENNEIFETLKSIFEIRWNEV